MGESFYETDINAKGLLRRMAAASIYNRMAQQARSSAMSASSTSESSSAAEAEDRRPADAAEGAGAGASAEKEDPMAKLEREMRKLDPKSKVVKKDGANKLRHRNDYRKPGDWSKKNKDEGGSKVDVAFNAFANSLLRTGQGKVRSFTIWSAFRQEFPSLSQETKVTNQTLGRKLSAWYMDAAGEPLNKIPGGSYGGLSIINPRFTSTDLTELRAAQALFEPNMKRKFETLGIEAGGAERGLAGGARKFEERQNRRRERTKQEGRVEVQKDRNGKVIRVVRRADPDKGITEKVLSGKPFAQPTNRVSELKKISPTVKMCVEAFANTMLTASPEGKVTFDDIKAAFTGQFPLLSSSDRMTDSFLGRVIVEWYKAKFDKPLVRKKTVEMAQQNLTRAEIPYSGLALLGIGEGNMDMQLLNEAKVALRRALEMEGVGILVKREGGEGDYKVAFIADGSPAAIEGSMRVGDSLISIGSRSASEMDTQELADAVLGKRGTRAKLTLGRIGEGGGLETYSVTLTRNDKQKLVDPSQSESSEVSE